MLNFSSYDILDGWDVSHFKGYILRHVSSSNPFLNNIREPKYKQNNMGHQIIDLLLTWLPDIIQRCFCTQDKPMDSTKLNMYQPSRMFVGRETV